MRIDGGWHVCDDAVVRPVFHGTVLGADGAWRPVLFLLDSGADCTVISAADAKTLRFDFGTSERPLGGVGGAAQSIEVATQFVLPCDSQRVATFRGNYSAMTDLEMLDMSVLGRDITNFFSVIVDRPGNVVSLIRPPHRSLIENA